MGTRSEILSCTVGTYEAEEGESDMYTLQPDGAMIMVVVWQILDEKGGLVTTCFKERDAVRAKDRCEAKGQVVHIEKIFDAHQKDRKPVVKQRRKKPEKPEGDETPHGHYPVTIFVQPGDLITSELGIAVEARNKMTEEITRMIINTTGKIVPVRTRDYNG